MNQQPAAVIIGVGPERGLGATLAKLFATKGLQVYIAGCSEDKLQQVADSIQKKGGKVTTVVADATQEHDVSHLFETIQYHGSTLQIAAYNVDSNIQSSILETESETFTKCWEQNCLFTLESDDIPCAEFPVRLSQFPSALAFGICLIPRTCVNA